MDFITNLFKAPYENVSPQEAQKKLVQQPKPFLLDVRQPEEYRSGHITGAKLIPLGELGARLHELPQAQEIICVCQSGSRSRSAAGLLTQKGFKQVYNLAGGMSAWQRSGLKIARG